MRSTFRATSRRLNGNRFLPDGLDQVPSIRARSSDAVPVKVPERSTLRPSLRNSAISTRFPAAIVPRSCRLVPGTPVGMPPYAYVPSTASPGNHSVAYTVAFPTVPVYSAGGTLASACAAAWKGARTAKIVASTHAQACRRPQVTVMSAPRSS
jgi:hypothetical protein